MFPLLSVFLLMHFLAAGPEVGGAVDPYQSPLEELAEEFAGAWSAGDERGVEGLLLPGAVSLVLEGRSYRLIDHRKARATLREYLAEHEAGETRVARCSVVEEDPRQAFAELVWDVSVLGVPELQRHTIFLGLRQAGGVWKVSEIRVLAPGG